MGGLSLSSNRQRRTYNFLTLILLNSYGLGELNNFWAHMKLLGFTTEVLGGSLELQNAWTAETRQDWSLGAGSEYPDDPHALFSEAFQALNKLTLVADHQFTSSFLARAEYRRGSSSRPIFLTDISGVPSRWQHRKRWA